MILKKCNSLCAWLLTAALLGHLATMGWSMLTGWYDYTVCKALARATAGIAVLHIALSLIILFFFTDGADLKRYPRRNRKTILQRASGLVIIAILHLHVKAFRFIVTGAALSAGAKTGLLVTETLFFGAIMVHLAVSFSKSLISLGLLRSDRAERNTDRAAYAICLALFAFAACALFSFALQWTGWAV